MEIYETEQDQVEALKKWWKENGRSVIAGLVIGVGGIGGWKLWMDRQEKQAINASTAYERLVQVVSTQRDTEAREQGDRLMQDYPKSAYATLSSLRLARLSLGQGNRDDARQYLQWVLDQAAQEELKDIARLRLARLLMADGQLGEALALVSAEGPAGFQAPYQETRGDILAAKGDAAGARAAYGRALAGLSPTGNRRLLQMKLDNLGLDDAGSPPARTETGS